MLVDDARQNVAPRGVYTFVVVSTGCLLILYDFFDTVIVDDEGAPERASLIDDGSALYLCSHYLYSIDHHSYRIDHLPPHPFMITHLRREPLPSLVPVVGSCRAEPSHWA